MECVIREWRVRREPSPMADYVVVAAVVAATLQVSCFYIPAPRY